MAMFYRKTREQHKNKLSYVNKNKLLIKIKIKINEQTIFCDTP